MTTLSSLLQRLSNSNSSVLRLTLLCLALEKPRSLAFKFSVNRDLCEALEGALGSLLIWMTTVGLGALEAWPGTPPAARGMIGLLIPALPASGSWSAGGVGLPKRFRTQSERPSLFNSPKTTGTLVVIIATQHSRAPHCVLTNAKFPDGAYNDVSLMVTRSFENLLRRAGQCEVQR